MTIYWGPLKWPYAPRYEPRDLYEPRYVVTRRGWARQHGDRRRATFDVWFRHPEHYRTDVWGSLPGWPYRPRELDYPPPKTGLVRRALEHKTLGLGPYEVPTMPVERCDEARAALADAPEKEGNMPSKYQALNDASRLAHASLTGASPNPEDCKLADAPVPKPTADRPRDWSTAKPNRHAELGLESVEAAIERCRMAVGPIHPERAEDGDKWEAGIVMPGDGYMSYDFGPDLATAVRQCAERYDAAQANRPAEESDE